MSTTKSDARPAPPPRAGNLDAVPFMRELGTELVRAADGEAELALTLQDWHLNSWGVAHGGVVMSLLDVAMARAGSSLTDQAPGNVTVEMKTSFFAPARGRLRAGVGYVTSGVASSGFHGYLEWRQAL